MAGPEEMPFDLAKLPPPELFIQYFKPTFHYSKGAGAGLYRRNEASFGPETWFGIGVLVGGIAPRFTGENAGPPGADTLTPPGDD
jgi:hypothetical protein